MFILTTIVDTMHVPADMYHLPTWVAINQKIDLKYPNKVLMDIGLVIARYGKCKITNGSCVPGEGGSHHECLFRLVVFRPFVEEVCVGTIVKSTPDGVQVSMGFFQDIFIPAYWMLRPSRYDSKTGLWVWTPSYDDDDEEGEGGEEGEGKEEKGDSEKKEGATSTAVKSEETESSKEDKDADNAQKGEEDDDENEAEGYGMDIGAEIRFKVKSIQFTQVTTTAKGVQATTTTTSHSHSFPNKDHPDHHKDRASSLDKPLRKRSTSVDLSDAQRLPASMYIVASICEDGLGLTSWWEQGADDEEEEEGKEGAEEEEEE